MISSIGDPQTYRFGVFEVDTLAHELRRQGVRIRLQEQPYQILLMLLERAGQVVTRDALRQRIWPASVLVDFDHGLNNSVARLREALGDAVGAARLIETVPRVGYRFLATVTTGFEQTAVAVPPRRCRRAGRRLLDEIGGAYISVVAARRTSPLSHCCWPDYGSGGRRWMNRPRAQRSRRSRRSPYCRSST